eukprot:scaffold194990_cov21-Prasinocladus_malaysianus.AAC.1
MPNLTATDAFQELSRQMSVQNAEPKAIRFGKIQMHMCGEIRDMRLDKEPSPFSGKGPPSIEPLVVRVASQLRDLYAMFCSGALHSVVKRIQSIVDVHVHPNPSQTKRGSNTDEEGGTSQNATPTVATGAHNYFGPADGLGLGGAVLSMPMSGQFKRGREWEGPSSGSLGAHGNSEGREGFPPLLNDTLADLDAEGENMEHEGEKERTNQTNYF